MWNLFKRNSDNQKKQKEQKIKKPNYKLDGLYLKDEIDLDPINEKIDENKKAIDANKIFIESNKNAIELNKNNVVNLDNKVDRIANDLANANIANYKGTYNANINYKRGDLVSSPDNNNVYLSVQDNNINNPLTNNNFWKIITFTIDTSDFITTEKLNNKLDDYWTANQTIQEINLKRHKKSYYMQLRTQAFCDISQVMQSQLYFYKTQRNLSLSAFNNVERQKDYFVEVFVRSINGDRGSSDVNQIYFTNKVQSDMSGNLIPVANNVQFKFLLDNLVAPIGNGRTIYFLLDIVAIRIGD